MHVICTVWSAAQRSSVCVRGSSLGLFCEHSKTRISVRIQEERLPGPHFYPYSPHLPRSGHQLRGVCVSFLCLPPLFNPKESIILLRKNAVFHMFCSFSPMLPKNGSISQNPTKKSSTRVGNCTCIWESQFYCSLIQCRCKHRIITWVRDTPALVSSCIPVSGFPIIYYHLCHSRGTVFSDCHYQVCSDLFL